MVFLGSAEVAQTTLDTPATVHTVEVADNYGHFQIEPLARGFGHTLGTPMRRILLSALPGAAIATARFDGVLHEFSTLEFMREDIVEFLLNVKRIRVRSANLEPSVVFLEKSGPAEVTAEDIELPSGVEIVNPAHYLATLTRKGTLRTEFTVEQGAGYVGAEERSGLPIGVIPLDMVFGPVTKIEYHVEQATVGRETEFDRLIIKIWTDGTMGPEDALRAAARQLVEAFGLIAGLEEGPAQPEPELALADAEAQGEPLEDLKLSNRAMNCLKRHGVDTIQELAQMSEEDLFGLRGMGVRLVEEIRDSLGSRGLSLAGEAPSEAPSEVLEG